MAGMFVSNPEKWLEEEAHAPDLFCIVIFRGVWCKYDAFYLRKLGKFLKSTADEKQTISLVAWTSQGAAAAAQADREWHLTKEFGFKHVLGDDTNALANYLIDDVILPKLLIKTVQETGLQGVVPAGSYPNGIVMPGIVWYAHHGSAPVFEWSHPCEAEPDGGDTNKAVDMGGPLRPDPADMWAQVLKRKHALDHGSAVMPSHNCKMCATEAQVNASGCQIS